MAALGWLINLGFAASDSGTPSFQAAWAEFNEILRVNGMKKNVASQVIGVQMVSATDGSAFTGTTSCLVTGDGGTQAAGGGTVTHEGNGFHTYAPTQAETNYDHIGFTFTGTGAIPRTVQVYTTFPQTGDNYARLGAPAGASVSADVAAIKSDTADILVDTGTSGVIVVTNNDKTGYSISGTKTTLDALNDLTAAQVNAEVDTALNTAIPGVPTAGSVNDVLASLDALLPGSGTLSTLTAANVNAEVVDALITDTYAELSAIPAATSSLKDKINFLFALARNKVTQSSTTQTLRNDADSADIGTSTHSDSGTVYTRGEWA